jgi:Na+/melibiose symporter-like transporter
MLAGVASLFANRAFVTLNLAMMAMIVAVTVLNKSVLYYFKYFVGSDDAGQSALAWMGVISGVAVPLWMLLQRVMGTRSLWFLAAGLCMAGLTLFAACGSIGRWRCRSSSPACRR